MLCYLLQKEKIGSLGPVLAFQILAMHIIMFVTLFLFFSVRKVICEPIKKISSYTKCCHISEPSMCYHACVLPFVLKVTVIHVHVVFSSKEVLCLCHGDFIFSILLVLLNRSIKPNCMDCLGCIVFVRNVIRHLKHSKLDISAVRSFDFLF